MRRLLSFICILGISSSSFAQTKDTSWANLNGLKPGQEIQVVDMNSKKHSGAFLSVSDAAISYTDALGEKSVLKQDVRTVKALKPNHRLRNTLIGTGVGAGSGAALFAGTWSTSGLGKTGAVGAVGALLGGLIGTVIGAVMPTHGSITLYSAPPK